MSNRFIKYLPSEKSAWLRENHPNAFLLLSLIAERARRTTGHIDGLEIGDAYIGDYAKAGIETEKKYRTAKDILCDIRAIKIRETCKNHKKGATSRATKGTIVTLLDSSVWDINSEEDGDLKGDLRATLGRPEGDEQEGIRKNKKEVRKKKINKKEIPPPVEKIAFREWVFLTQHEYDMLIARYEGQWPGSGQSILVSAMEHMDAYKASKSITYDSDFHVLNHGWMWNRTLENISSKSVSSVKNPGESNIKFAQTAIQEYFSPTCEIFENGVEVCFSNKIGQAPPLTLKYRENGFKEQFENLLRKRGFTKIGVKNG